jgi:hypothetical protein
MTNPPAGETGPSGRPKLNRRRTTVLFAIAGTLLALGIGVGAGPLIWPGESRAMTPTVRAQAPRESVHMQTSKLFVVDGMSAWAKVDGKGEWTINLSGANKVLWFADRPARASGNITAASLAATWKSLFQAAPPSGAILAPDGPRGHRPTAIRLLRATYDGARDILTFELKSDRGQSATDTAWLSKLTKAGAAKNGRVVIFVDGSDYMEQFLVAAPNPTYIFTPNVNASTCGHPWDLPPTNGGGSRIPGTTPYFGTTDIDDSGDCFGEPSKLVWDVTTWATWPGTPGGPAAQLVLESRNGQLSCDQGCYYDSAVKTFVYQP